MPAMITAHPQILALVATLGVMPIRRDRDDHFFFYAPNGVDYIHAGVHPDYRGKLRFYIGASEGGGYPEGSYTTGQLPLDADISSLSLERPFDTLRALWVRYPFNERTGDFD